MKTLDAYASLLRMRKPVLTTADAALRLHLSAPEATRLLSRLMEAGFARRIRRGLWTLDPKLDPLVVPEHLTAPFPAYVSFQSALHLHGMISQIPQIAYVASLGPTRQIHTALGTYSFHRLSPEFFGGYETAEDSGIRLATAEKALLDVLYLGSARSRLFAHLPELSLPRRFRAKEAQRWIDRIRDPSRRTMVKTRLFAIRSGARRAQAERGEGESGASKTPAPRGRPE